MNIVTILNAKTVDLSLHGPIINKLYSCYEHKKTRYEMIKNAEQLRTIKSENCYASVQFQGVAYILFLCIVQVHDKTRKMNILIPKRDLKEQEHQNNLSKINMYSIHFPFANSSYYEDGTILDGKMIKTNSMNKINHAFLIHEIYNRNMTNIDLKDKHQIIKRDFLPKLSGHKLDFKIAKIYDLEQIPDLLFNKLSETKYSPIGLMFLFRKTRSYYVLTNEKEFSILQKKQPLPESKTYENTTQEFKMTNPDSITDVYKLYDINDNTYIGLAAIPNKVLSQYYREQFKHNTIIKVKCIMSEKFGKWLPLMDESYDHIIDII